MRDRSVHLYLGIVLVSVQYCSCFDILCLHLLCFLFLFLHCQNSSLLLSLNQYWPVLLHPGCPLEILLSHYVYAHSWARILSQRARAWSAVIPAERQGFISNTYRDVDWWRSNWQVTSRVDPSWCCIPGGRVFVVDNGWRSLYLFVCLWIFSFLFYPDVWESPIGPHEVEGSCMVGTRIIYISAFTGWGRWLHDRQWCVLL